MPGTNDFDIRNRPHIPIERFRESSTYTYPSRNQKRKPLRGDYAAHAAKLLEQLSSALGDLPPRSTDARRIVPGLKLGTVVEVTTIAPSGPRAQAAKIPASLDFPVQDVVVLRAERNSDRTESALLFVPDDARAFLKDRITEYGRAPDPDHRPDINRFEILEQVDAAGPEALFTGSVDLNDPAIVWWELWVRQPTVQIDQIVAAARTAQIDVHEDRLLFPDTAVLFLHAAAATIAAFATSLPGAITDIRQATGTIETFLTQGRSAIGPQQWMHDLADRVVPATDGAPVVCLLDTGVSARHPLIAPALRGAWSYDEAWGVDDHGLHGGHGTPLAGLVLYGDLEPLMNDSRYVFLTHDAESMKLLPPRGFPPTKPPSYGVVTQGAVSAVEIERPGAKRIFCIACSTEDLPPDRPSTWSGALDQIASGSMPGEASAVPTALERPKRLLVVATGNVQNGMIPDVLTSQPLEDPAQSWNALTIGGFTRKDLPPRTPTGLKPAVPANHRSPFSRGSQSLPSDLTPIKPEVLFEAGNMLADASGFCEWGPSVSLLSTGSNVAHEPLVPMWATSAATGMAGHFLGRLQAALPSFWPETLRALVVDSARWTEPMRKKLIGTGAHWKTGTKKQFQAQLREVGYGVPDLERATLSAANDATLIAQSEIQPYALGSDGKTGVFNQVHFYDLPWPKSALEQLENEVVSMKVTLSYFIEPNLTGKAATRPETYRSFGLRFEMKKRGETNARFKHRISSSQQKDGSESEQEASYWLLGSKAFQAGSLHCDVWRGRAIELAGHDAIAIYPVGGWWKSHSGQRRVNNRARYSLVISISAPGCAVDLRAEVEALVHAKAIEVAVEATNA